MLRFESVFQYNQQNLYSIFFFAPLLLYNNHSFYALYYKLPKIRNYHPIHD